MLKSSLFVIVISILVIFTFFQAVQIQKRDFTMFESLMLVNHSKNEGGFWELRESSPPKDR